jgi:hypothetical protein
MAGEQRTRDEYTMVTTEVFVEGESLMGNVRVCERHYDTIRRALICDSERFDYPEDDPSTLLPDQTVQADNE